MNINIKNNKNHVHINFNDEIFEGDYNKLDLLNRATLVETESELPK